MEHHRVAEEIERTMRAWLDSRDPSLVRAAATRLQMAGLEVASPLPRVPPPPPAPVLGVPLGGCCH